MKKPPKIPAAREMILAVIQSGTVDALSRRMLGKALLLMYRAKPVRLAPRKRQRITKEMRRKIFRLAPTDLNMNQIAAAVGVHNQGRISEVLTGQR